MRIVHVAGEVAEPERLLADAAGYCRDWGVEAETAVLSGLPGKALLREAEDYDAGLVVLSHSPRGVMRRTLFGDVLGQVMRTCDRALFLAH